jgi:hypothetical protein
MRSSRAITCGLSVVDQPGVFARIANVLAKAKIGISSIIQPEGHAGETVPVILMIHDAPERRHEARPRPDREAQRREGRPGDDPRRTVRVRSRCFQATGKAGGSGTHLDTAAGEVREVLECGAAAPLWSRAHAQDPERPGSRGVRPRKAPEHRRTPGRFATSPATVKRWARAPAQLPLFVAKFPLACPHDNCGGGRL